MIKRNQTKISQKYNKKPKIRNKIKKMMTGLRQEINKT